MDKLNIDFNQSYYIIVNELDKYFNEFISNLKTINDEKEIKKNIKNLMSSFEKECLRNGSQNEIRIRDYFYRQIFNISQSLKNKNLILFVKDEIVKNIDKVLKNIKSMDNPYYMLLIDTIIISALYFYEIKDYNESYNLFVEAVTFGENNINDSRNNYYDALNCAYTWVGFYLFNSGKYEEALPCFERVIQLDNSVKDDPNYSLKEKDSVPNSINYIKVIKEKMEKR